MRKRENNKLIGMWFGRQKKGAGCLAPIAEDSLKGSRLSVCSSWCRGKEPWYKIDSYHNCSPHTWGIWNM